MGSVREILDDKSIDLDWRMTVIMVSVSMYVCCLYWMLFDGWVLFPNLE